LEGGQAGGEKKYYFLAWRRLHRQVLGEAGVLIPDMAGERVQQGNFGQIVSIDCKTVFG